MGTREGLRAVVCVLLLLLFLCFGVERVERVELLLGDRNKLAKCKNLDQQVAGVNTPYTIDTETGALGKDFIKKNS